MKRSELIEVLKAVNTGVQEIAKAECAYDLMRAREAAGSPISFTRAFDLVTKMIENS